MPSVADSEHFNCTTCVQTNKGLDTHITQRPNFKKVVCNLALRAILQGAVWGWLQEERYLLDGVSQPHDVRRLPADLRLGRVQEDVEICHVLKLGVVLLTGVHKVLNFCHGEFPSANKQTHIKYFMH